MDWIEYGWVHTSSKVQRREQGRTDGPTCEPAEDARVGELEEHAQERVFDLRCFFVAVVPVMNRIETV